MRYVGSFTSYVSLFWQFYRLQFTSNLVHKFLFAKLCPFKWHFLVCYVIESCNSPGPNHPYACTGPLYLLVLGNILAPTCLSYWQLDLKRVFSAQDSVSETIGRHPLNGMEWLTVTMLQAAFLGSLVCQPYLPMLVVSRRGREDVPSDHLQCRRRKEDTAPTPKDEETLLFFWPHFKHVE